MTRPQRRNRRAGVEDRWVKTVRDEDGNETKVPSARGGKGLRWLARYVDDDGREQTRSFAKKSTAKDWLDEQLAGLVTGTHVDPARAKVTFGGWFEQWATDQVWTAGTRAAYAQAYKSVTFADVPMARLDEAHLQAWVKAMVDDDLAASTVKNRFALMAGALRAAQRGRRRVLGYDVTSGVTLPRPTGRLRIPTSAEVRHLLDAAPGGFRAAVALGAFAGCRDGEVRGLMVSDVRFLAREVSIERQAGRSYEGVRDDAAAPKYDSARTVSVSERLMDEVAAHVRGFLPGEGDRWLFPGSGDRPASSSTMNRRWQTTRDGLDWPMHFHDLRHFFASGLIAAGCDVKTVQHALGHKSAAMTLDVYADLWPDGNDRARAAGDRLMAQVLDTRVNPSRTSAAD